MRKKRIIFMLFTVTVSVMLASCNPAGNKRSGTKETLTEALSQEEGQSVMVQSSSSGQQMETQRGEMQQEEQVADGIKGVLFSEAVKEGLEDADEKLFESTAVQPVDMTTANHMVGDRALPIYCVDTQEKKVGLSFDAAWGNSDTEQILEILENHGIQVTFFMTGGWVESYPEDVKAILAAGHDLGNHSENHKNMSQLSNEEKQEEVMQVHTKVKELTGYDMFLFRPPYGDYDNAVIEVVKDCGYYPIQWDVDSLDWQNKGVEDILKTVTNHKDLGNGSIILCHNGAEYTAEALDRLLNELETQGYEIVPISELIYKDHYHINVQGRQIADAA